MPIRRGDIAVRLDTMAKLLEIKDANELRDPTEAVLDRLRPPTLLIVGGADHEVIGLDERALRALAGEKVLWVVPDATRLF